jgi:putative tryptophan/tyrosine transport system substrate-binding protein
MRQLPRRRFIFAVKAMCTALRRQFLAAVGTLLFALLPLHPANSQQLVGVLSITAPPTPYPGLGQRLFESGLRELGYKDGQSLTIDYQWAHGDISRYPKLAREMIERRPAVIFASCGPALRAIRGISSTIPVIAICADEKNFLGEVASLARPGGYTTGMTFLSPESIGKRLELLREIRPGLTRLAVIHELHDPLDAHMLELQRLQSIFGLTLQILPLTRGENFDAVFEAMVRERAQALLLFPTNRISGDLEQVTERARKYRIPTFSELPGLADRGGLMSYGWNVKEVFGKTAPMYVDKILKGTKPGDLPILQSSQFELVVNLDTARVLGIKIPRSVLLRANRVID